jgi:hypothetical protein
MTKINFAKMTYLNGQPESCQATIALPSRAIAVAAYEEKRARRQKNFGALEKRTLRNKILFPKLKPGFVTQLPSRWQSPSRNRYAAWRPQPF